jgi:hypothetical protein
VLRRIFGQRKDEVTRGWVKLHNEELHNLYSSSSRVKPALKGNIFRSRDFGAEKDVKYPGLNGNGLMQKRKSK